MTSHISSATQTKKTNFALIETSRNTVHMLASDIAFRTQNTRSSPAL
ncbi:hypothetical protein DSUL_20066 [Desulfovibrionales bacterium]